MAGEQSYIRVPPDSTGKKVRHQPFIRAQFTKEGTQSSHIWGIQDTYNITGSVTMNVTLFKGPAASVQSGWIAFNASEADVMSATIPTSGDSIYYGGNKIATLNTVEYIHVPYTHISGGDTPHNTANVDDTGSLNIRFAEGRPQLDAFGKLKQSQTQIIGDYTFAVDAVPTMFSSVKVGAGADVSYNMAERAGITLTLDPDSTTYDVFGNSVNGAVTHTSNTWHHYTPGLSQLYMATIVVSNPNVSGSVYRWGYNDLEDGLFFMVDGDTGSLNVVVRSSTSGVVVDTVVTQADWNGDKLDGSGDSQMIINVSKDNIYWIDFQWLGAGSVRFGVFHNGQRITCHTIDNDNISTRPYMRTGSLPVCQSVMAKSGVTMGSTATLKTYCIGVYTEGETSKDIWGGNTATDVKGVWTAAEIDGTEYLSVGSISPMVAHDHGSNPINRSIYFPDELEVLALADDAGSLVPAMGELEIRLNPLLRAATWTNVGYAGSLVKSHMERDETGKFISSGDTVVIKYINNDGHGIFNMYDVFKSMSHGGIKNNACAGGNYTQPLLTVSSATTAVAQFAGGLTPFREWSENLTFENGTGDWAALNGASVYLRPIDTYGNTDSFELYSDAGYTTPINTSAYAAFTDVGSAYITGQLGTRFVVTALWKPFNHTDKDQTVRVKIQWKEVVQ